MIAGAERRIDGQQPWGRHGLFRYGAFVAARGHRPSINVRISPPEHLARLPMLNLASSSVFRSRYCGCDSKRWIRSPTTCICSISSSVISTPANWSSIASINSTRSSKSAPRSFVKCVSLVTNSMSTPSCFAMRVQTSLMQSTSFKGPWPLKRCQATNVHDEAPDSLLACNNVQINAPGTVTLFQKFWSVALGSHPFFF